jgi:hypothetical protein
VRLVFASLIVVLMAMSYGVEAMGVPLLLGLAPVRLLVFILASLWAFVEALLLVRAQSASKEQLLQARLVLNAAREEASEVRAALTKLQQEVDKTGAAPRGGDALHVLALLQQKGRFLDFVMDDVTKYPDAQIGAAARVVHQGCAAVVREYFDIKPVSEGAEGGVVTLDKDYDHHKYRLMGRISGEAPYRGRVLHRGWLTTHVSLPERVTLGTEGASQNVIAPAEIEVS